MGMWNDRDYRTGFDDAEDLAYAPTGGSVKAWVVGIGLALIPFLYGVHCWLSGHALFFGQDSDMDVTGKTAVSLAIAYMAVGLFVHAHWFWGLTKHQVLSYLLKLIAVLVFIGGFGYAIYKILAR